ncbi:hypothetical protein BsWGS_18799 [Bradybaena similaris]
MSHVLKPASNHENRHHGNRISQNNHLAKKEEYAKSRSEVIQKLIMTKEQNKEEAQRREKEKKEREEKRQNTFRIPKKKPEQNVDVEKLINSLFDDTETPDEDSQPCIPEKKDDKPKTDALISRKNHSTGSSSLKEETHSSSSNGLSHNNKDLKGNTSGKQSSSLHSHEAAKGSTSDKHSSSSQSHKDSKGNTSDKHSYSSHNHEASKGSTSDKHSSSSHSHKDSKGSTSDKHSSSSHSHKDSKGSTSDKHSSSSHSHEDSKGITSDKHSSSSHSHKDSKGNTPDKHSSSSHGLTDSKRNTSDKHSSSSHSHKDSKGNTSDKHSSSSHSHKDSKGNISDKHSSSSHSRHNNPKSSDPSKHSEHKSGTSSTEIRSSSSSQDHKHKSSSGTSKSSSGGSKSHDSERSRKEASSGETKHSSINSSSSKSHSSSKPKEPVLSKLELKSSPSSSSKDGTQHQPSLSDQQPIVLNKHHLNPTVERQASSTLSEKEQILARLQAIKQRTLEAIHKENSGKGRRGKGERAQRKTKTEVKQDDKSKSVEFIKDIVSSEDEDDVYKGVPDALDIMLSERNAKLEKEKISRMAKQAWERAMKKDAGEPEKEVKVKKHKSSNKDVSRTHKHNRSGSNDKKNNNKTKESSLSPRHDTIKPSPKPKKPVIVRHSVQSSAPPMDFKAILEMAEKKQKEAAKPLAAIPKKKREEEERPLTQEEKDRRDRKKTREYQDWLKFGGKPPAKPNNSSDEDELPALSSENNHDKRQTPQHSALNDKNKTLSGSSKQSLDKQGLNKDGSRNHQATANGGMKNKHKNITVNENVLVCGPGSDDEEPEEKSLNPFDRILNQFKKKRPAQQTQSAVPAKKGRFEDSEEEEEEDYDPDMDDFIDDGDDHEPDYSKEIKQLFGYDKSKYKYERDEDLSDMEADYATVMKEEKLSAKLGLMEDLEDMRKEQEELKRKAMLKKRK